MISARAGTVTVTSLLIVGLMALPTSAPAKIRGIPSLDSQFRKGAKAIARAVAVKPRRHVRRVRFSLLPPGGRPAAVSTTKLGGFPRHGKSFLILSTGDARLARRKNRTGSLGRGQGGPFVRGARDVTILRIDLRVPSASCLSFRFRFLSEEFPEFVNDLYNDFFIAELGDSTWSSVSNDDPTISAPGNFAFGPENRLITVNGTDAASVTAANARGTTYDGATDVLRASTPVSRGRRTLYLSIGDQGDRDFDSAVFIDRLTLNDTSPCETGVVVE